MNNFLTVFLREFRETLRSRFFIATSVLFGIILLLAFAALMIFQFIPDSAVTALSPDEFTGITDGHSSVMPYTVIVDDRSGGTFARLPADEPMIDYLEQPLTDAAIRAAFENGADRCLIIHENGDITCYLSPFSSDFSLTEAICADLDDIARQNALMQHGFTVSDADALLHTSCNITYSEVSRSDLLTPPDDDSLFPEYIDAGASIGVYLVASLMFMAISFYGQMVSARVMHEKSSRMIEVLATSASPFDLLCGKVLGVGAAGFSQILLFYTLLLSIGGAVLGRLTGIAPELAGIFTAVTTPLRSNAVFIFIYLLLGFVQLAFIYGGLGAMSSDSNSVSGFAAIPLQLPMLGYFIAMFAPALTGTLLLTAASHLPIFAPFAMPARLGIEQVAWWELLISITVQIASIIVTAILSSRLYRRGMLRFGQPPKTKELLGLLRK